MSMILVGKNDISIGKPLPWQLYDKEHNVLVEQGGIVRDNGHLENLLANGIYRELSWETPGSTDDDNDPTAGKASPNQTKADEASVQYTFDDMKLAIESRLQFEPAAQLSSERYFVKVIGFLRGASLLVTTPASTKGESPPELKEGLKVVMCSFSGQSAFKFTCTIKYITKLPYKYLHLSFPEIIHGTVIRKAIRIKTRIIVAVNNSKLHNEGEQVSALISNISANGAALAAKRPMGEKGDILNMVFRVNLYKIDALLSIKGVIRALLGGAATDIPDPEVIRYGIEFQNLQPNDMVILQSWIYQQIIENPHQLM